MSIYVICNTGHFHFSISYEICFVISVYFILQFYMSIAIPFLKPTPLPPVLLCLRELLRHTSARSHQRREPPHHLSGTPQPAQKLPHTQQIAQQPGEGCRGLREQRGRLRPVRQVLLNILVLHSYWGPFVVFRRIDCGKRTCEVLR